MVVNPYPPQAPHVVADVPGFAPEPLQVLQVSVLPKVTVFVAPLIASIKSIYRLS